MRAMIRFDSRPRLGEIQSPILVVTGEDATSSWLNDLEQTSEVFSEFCGWATP
ncbi:MAG: hypothetical protein AB1846_18305 [Chloroflexota bacterium]